jgi:hypothetical protein
MENAPFMSPKSSDATTLFPISILSECSETSFYIVFYSYLRSDMMLHAVCFTVNEGMN